jgi:hypothetical protein
MPTRAHYETALRAVIAELDYDLHKGIERHEETGENEYPELAAKFERLVDEAVAADGEN